MKIKLFKHLSLLTAACLVSPLMSLSAEAQTSCSCNWYGSTIPLCQNTTQGWGWESNKSCVGSSTCTSAGGAKAVSCSTNTPAPTPTPTPQPTGKNSITVRMSGTTGQESVDLEIGGTVVKTWTLGTSMRSYTVSTNYEGELRVSYTNDSGDRDVRVDYVTVNGTTYQAEDQQDNTGAYSGSCGGGSYSEMLHCSGSIGFGNPWRSIPSGSEITVRMTGFTGEESVNLEIGGDVIETWTLGTRMANYTVRTSKTGQLRVNYTNDRGDRDVQVDYVVVDGAYFQAEDQKDNTGAYSGSCGGGSYSEMLHCSGSIGFGNPWTGEASNSGPQFPDFFVGNITTNGSVRSDFVRYWDQITPENEGKWGSVERTRDVYNWGPVDAIYNYTRQHGIPMKAHTMVWGSQRPAWIDGLSASAQRAEIEEWIRDYCTRYPDTEMMDVVNEAIDSHAPARYAENAFGSNWITESFKLARKYCPNTILVYNDYNFLTWNTDEIMATIRPAVQAGVVDALGMQAHGLLSTQKTWSTAELKAKLDKISTLGVPIYITELDIQSTNDQTQLNYMRSVFPMFYNHPNVKGITIWGYVVGATWRNGTGLIYSDGRFRPAMTWLMNYLGR